MLLCCPAAGQVTRVRQGAAGLSTAPILGSAQGCAVMIFERASTRWMFVSVMLDLPIIKQRAKPFRTICNAPGSPVMMASFLRL